MINIKYYSMASGNEGGGEENIRGHIKNIAEEDLMKTEDEIHEFDSIIQRFWVALIWISSIEKEKEPCKKVDKILEKLKNIKILNLIYEKKADHILDLAHENPAQIFSLIKKRIELRLKLLEA